MIITEDLIRRIERSEAGRVASCAQAFGGKLLEVCGGIASNCGEGNVMTQCVAIGHGGEPKPSDLAQVLSHYSTDCAQFEFKLSPLSSMELREWVVRRASAIPEFETLLILDISQADPPPAQFEMREIDKAGALGYAERAARRFYGESWPAGLIEVIAAASIEPNTRSFEACVDGKPVGGCSVGFAEGIAWLGGGAVDVEHRGKGIHKAMQAHRIRLAKEMGYSLMAQGAMPGSISQQNAQKSGFEIAFARPTFMVQARERA